MTWVFIVYLGALIGLALWSRRETRTVEGYFLAGRKLPPWVVAFSANATGESGWLLLGLTGMGYAVGVQAFWIAAGEVLGVALAWGLLSRRLKRLADETDSITVPDVLEAGLQDPKQILRKLSLAIILIMVTFYVAAQMVATGKALDGFTDLSYSSGLLLGAGVIIAYTLIGGFKAVAWSDLLQGLLMLAGLIVLPSVAIDAAGGFSQVVDELGQQDPGLLSPWGPEGESPLALIAILSFLAIGIPFVGAPQLMVRFMSARSEASLGPAMAISVVVIALFDIGAVLTGMAGRVLLPGLEDPEAILPALSNLLLHPALAGVMMIVVLAAIMSTVDSLLILASSAVVRDYLQKIRGSTLENRSLVKIGKWVTLAIGLIGAAFGLNQTPLIFWFVLFAWSGLGAAFGPPLLCLLWFPMTTYKGAAAGMLAGFATTVLWVVFFKAASGNLLEIIPGFAVGLAVTLGVSRATSASHSRRSGPAGDT